MSTRLAALLAATLATPVVAQDITFFPNVSASLQGLAAPVVDSTGDVYVASRNTHGVLRLSGGAIEVVLDLSSGLPDQEFLQPASLAVDSQDVLYVACRSSNNVYRLDTDGTVSVVLDVSGDGLGETLLAPDTLVVDDDDTVWVAGATSDNVFSIDSAGVVTVELTSAGIGTGALDDPRVHFEDGVLFVIGTGRVFRRTAGGAFEEILDPTGDGSLAFTTGLDVAVDTAGDTLVTTNGSAMFRIDTSGVVTVIPIGAAVAFGAGVETTSDGSAWVTGFDLFGQVSFLSEIEPGGSPVVRASTTAGSYGNLVADATDTLYWTQTASVGSDWLWRRASDGTMTVMIGQLGDGMGHFVDAALPLAVRGDGSVVVAGGTTPVVLDAGSSGTVELLAEADSLVTLPVSPEGLAVDHEGHVFMSGSVSNDVVRVAPDGQTSVVVLDASGDGLGNAFITPGDVAVDAQGNLFATGTISDNVFRVTPGGVVTELLDATGDGRGNTLDRPTDVAVDAQGNVFVAGFQSDNVFKVTPAGVVTQILDATGDGVHGLDAPHSLAVDGLGNVYVTGWVSDNVFRVTPGGVVTELLDAAGDGLGNPLDAPAGIAATWHGDVWVAGSNSSNLFHVASGGAVTEVLDATGLGPEAELNIGADVAVDPFGVVYVSGQLSHNVLRWDPATGTGAELIDASGAGTWTSLSQPRQIALDLSGNLYVAGTISSNTFRVTQDDWWTDLGGASLGSNGRPTMVDKGDLSFPSTQERVLTNVPPNALMLVWIAFTSTPFDAIGGTVHAFPFSQQIFFVADPTGYSALAVPWPSGVPAGIDVYLQFVVQDLAVPAGLTLSNAAVQTTP